MKRVLFLTSHFCSGSNVLFESLSDHPRIEGYRTHSAYESSFDLIKLTGLNHKLGNSSAVYMDELLVNYSLASKTLYQQCNYVFMIRQPRGTLNEIAATMGYNFSSASSYYCLRLNRLASIARQASRRVLLLSEDIESGGEQIAEMLSLKEPIVLSNPTWKDVDDAVPQKVLLECQKVYDQTIEVMRSLRPSKAISVSSHSGN